MNEVEDERHFTCVCPAYDELRERLRARLSRLDDFCIAVDDDTLLRAVMGAREQGPQKLRAIVSSYCAQFVLSALRLRNRHLHDRKRDRSGVVNAEQQEVAGHAP